MTEMWAVLDENKNVIGVGLFDGEKWFEANDRHVADDMVNDARISIVFIGVNHDHAGRAPSGLKQ